LERETIGMTDLKAVPESALSVFDGALAAAGMAAVCSGTSLDMLSEFVEPWQMAAVLRLAFPRLVRFDEWVLRAENTNENNVAGFVAAGVQGNDLERVINHIHLWDVTKIDGEAEPFSAAFSGVRALLPFSWSMWIPHCTGRRVEVMSWDTEDDYGPTITFFTHPA
jgi:hypothetical protein